MNSLRAEVFNVLLCLVLGGAVGGVLTVGLGPKPATSGFEVSPTITVTNDAGLQALGQIDDAAQRQHALFNVMTRFALTDMPRALAQLPDDTTHDAILDAWIDRRLIKDRADLATQAALAMHDQARRDALITRALLRWHRADSAKAAQWLREHVNGGLAKALTATAMNDDPAFIGRMLLESPNAAMTQPHLDSLIRQWLLLDAEDALRFLETMPAARMTPGMFRGTGEALVLLPANRLDQLLTIPSPPIQDALISEALRALPQMLSATGARQWLEQLHAPRFAGPAVVRWFHDLTLEAPEEAQSALDALSPAWERDDCIEGCVNALGLTNRVQALDWTLELKDSKRRYQQASAQWKAWATESPSEAEAWLNDEAAKTLFSSPQRSALLKVSNRGGSK